MVDDSPVPLFRRTAAFSNLEVLNSIRTCCNCLHGNQLMHARSSVFVEWTPVHKSRSRFHHHKWFVLFHASEKCMVKAALQQMVSVCLPVVVHFRIVVPADYIDEILHVVVIVIVEHFHKVCGSRLLGASTTKCINLKLHEISCRPGRKSLPIQIQS